MELLLGELENEYKLALAQADQDDILNRIWQHDHTLWSDSPNEVTNRLGWLHSCEVMRPQVKNIHNFVEAIIMEGFTNVLLIGMGGSSLAPEVFRKIFGVKPGFLELDVLDSTHPKAVSTRSRHLDIKKTLVIVSTKSGTTVETLSLYKYFYHIFADSLGRENAGKHYVAITDPGSKLETIAREQGFRHIFLNDPNIGGRFSALSYFGLVPAALIGVDLDILLDHAEKMAALNQMNVSSSDAPGIRLGLALGVAANHCRDKATFILPQKISPFGAWVEQLIAESTGKSGKGILPIIAEELGDPSAYGDDRNFIFFQQQSEDATENIQLLSLSGHPIIILPFRNEHEIAGQFFLWEIAIAVAGHSLRIQPFNQPDVESSKKNTNHILDTYVNSGTLPEEDHVPLKIDSIKSLLSGIESGDYVAIQAYMEPNEYSCSLLHKLRMRIRDKYHVATTLGFGPRFLHSTGQLHKGDRGNGHFIQFVSKSNVDVPIPDEAGQSGSNISFGVLMNAQALGDAQALRQNNRNLISFLIYENQLAIIDEWINEL